MGMAGDGSRIDNGVDSPCLDSAARQTPEGFRLVNESGEHKRQNDVHVGVVHVVEVLRATHAAGLEESTSLEEVTCSGS